jgi:hypothetical protein
MAAALIAAAAGPARLAAQSPVPFGPGVVYNYVMHNIGTEDWQFFTAVQSITPDETIFEEVRSMKGPDGKPRHSVYRRTVSRREMANARGIDNGPGCNASDSVDTQHRGSVLRMASQRVFREIKTEGQAQVTVFYQLGCSEIFTASGVLARVEPNPVKVSILLNGKPLDLSTIHVRGRLGSLDQEQDVQFWFLDDPDRPWMVRESTIWGGKEYMQQLGTILFPDPKVEKEMEEALEKDCRAPTYGILFETASAELYPASRPTLAQIGSIMKRHPDWRLTIEGHTDSIGGAASNLDLSNRRAAAVKAALTSGYGVSADRLLTKGFGLTRPVQTNTTIEGRARNRRVELVRACK